MQRLLIRDFQLHAAVEDIAFQTVERNDFLVAAAVAEVLLGDSPERIPMHHGMDAVIFRRLCAGYGECGNLDGRHDGVPAALVPVDDRTVPADLIDIPAEFLHPGRDGFTAVVGAAGDGHEVTHFYRTGGRLCGLCGFCLAAQLRRDLLGEVTHTSIHPVAGAAFVGEPFVDGQHHFIRLRIVAQRFRLISKPEQLGFTVALADIHAELDESLIHNILKRIRLGGVGCALNGDCPLVICIAGRAPAAVFLLHIHPDSSVCADAIVAACLP